VTGGRFTLEGIAPCLQGEIPSILATCSAAGEPNLVHLSQVLFVDDDHVAISNQFLSKTAGNLTVNPIATLLCPDPATGVSFKLLVRYERSERDGPRFDAARIQLDAVAALTGMQDVFALRAIDIFRVLDISEVPTRGSTPRP
jgi:predicted pyridoxine 5'-phosphate oxidase superfamily flavin-nucleotide-binding protein